MPRRVVAAPDKFRGTVTASQVAEAIEWASLQAEWRCDLAPMADGGEGTLDVLGGLRKTAEVTGPLGQPVWAQWTQKGTVALIEMAQASGLHLAGGPEGNHPLDATTQGTGELIATAMKAGAEEIAIGLGGSATTDGGLGCLKALWPHSRLAEVDLTVLVDTDTRFLDCPRVFAPQKGATPAQVALLERRLSRLADEYERDFGFDVRELSGAGAAGGLAGGLAAVGASLVPGFTYLADLVELEERIDQADLVITGEGHLDAQSFTGKVVGGVLDLAARTGTPAAVICGAVDDEVKEHPMLAGTTVVSLLDRFGDAAFTRTADCLTEVTKELLDQVG